MSCGRWSNHSCRPRHLNRKVAGCASRPEKLHAHKGYDILRCREALRLRGIKARTHLSTRHRHEREVGTAPAGSGADAGLLGTLPAVKGTLRETSRHPPGVPQSWVRADLLELLTTVLLGAPSAWKENSTKLDFRVTEF